LDNQASLQEQTNSKYLVSNDWIWVGLWDLGLLYLYYWRIYMLAWCYIYQNDEFGHTSWLEFTYEPIFLLDILFKFFRIPYDFPKNFPTYKDIALHY
jgi:hypothetical protein